jgi:hypothetical protein
MTAIASRRQVVLLTTATLALVTGCSFGRSEVTVVNRTTQDIVVRFGYQFGDAVFVPGCGEVAFDPGVRHELPETPATAVELQIRLGLPPEQQDVHHHVGAGVDPPLIGAAVRGACPSANADAGFDGRLGRPAANRAGSTVQLHR